MSTSLDDVIERAHAREIVGVFRSRRDLDGTFEALQLGGFNRADFDAVSELVNVPQPPSSVAPTGKRPVILRTTREPVIMSDDANTASAVIAGILGTVCALAAVSWVTAAGGQPAAAVLAAFLGGIAVGGIAYIVTPRFLGNARANSAEGIAFPSGYILRVRVLSPDREEKARQILRGHGAKAIKVRDIEGDKRLEDIPWSSLKPDPWLGDDRLGQP